MIEIGFGSDLNLAHYPAGVDRIIAVEPSPLTRRLATDRIAASAIPVELVGLDGQQLSLADDSADVAVTTFTLCSNPDVVRAPRELVRVRRPTANCASLNTAYRPTPPSPPGSTASPHSRRGSSVAATSTDRSAT